MPPWLPAAALSESEQEVRRQHAQLAAIYHNAPVGLAFGEHLHGTHRGRVGLGRRPSELPPEAKGQADDQQGEGGPHERKAEQ